jgi:hypothetical protein
MSRASVANGSTSNGQVFSLHPTSRSVHEASVPGWRVSRSPVTFFLGHNTLGRKSSEAYGVKLFGALIAWRANKQDTVTTFATETELLRPCHRQARGLGCSTT